MTIDVVYALNIIYTGSIHLGSYIYINNFCTIYDLPVPVWPVRYTFLFYYNNYSIMYEYLTVSIVGTNILKNYSYGSYANSCILSFQCLNCGSDVVSK